MKKLFISIAMLIIYILFVLTVVIYLYAFFPIENKLFSSELPKCNHQVEYVTKDPFHKLILVIVDALRFDFVLPIDGFNKYMPFTTLSVLSNESCIIKLKAQAPTVTMPRLKALTTGMIPTYFDVVSNFMASESKHDSFIQQAVNNKLKLVFYGDDTWIKLFPNSFVRNEGTNSFFASDYEEVDYNVTRNVDKELLKDDWDFLILHYLGLDHIGHMEGPKSTLIAPKLKEMDSVIVKLYKHMQKLEEDGKKTLLLLTSDHGMKDSGGHGGMTTPEVILPLVSFGKKCNHLAGWPLNEVSEQIDLAPTISFGFGIPIPHNNCGKLIPALLQGMDVDCIMKGLELNLVGLRSQVSHTKGDLWTKTPLERWSLSSNFTKDQKKTVDWYFHELNKLSKNLSKVTGVHHMYLIISNFLMWIILVMLFSIIVAKFSKPVRPSQFFLIFGTLLSSISLFSTSFIEEEHQTWYFFWVTFCSISLFENMRLKSFTLTKNMIMVTTWIGLMISHRFLRKLNQTGDKWAMLPDLKFFFHSSENHHLLSLMFLSGLCLLLMCAFKCGCDSYQLLMFSGALFSILCYRISVGGVFQFEVLSFYPKSRGLREFKIFWICVAVFSIQSYRKNTPAYLFWSLVGAMFLKPHNVILVGSEILASWQIHKWYNYERGIYWNSIAHLWLGQVFYFYQGNGNSLANVDVAAGFVGLEGYIPMLSVPFVAVHTNTSHILAFLLSPRSNLILSAFKVLPMTLYCSSLLFQLDHLFLWSVFSPKLLYEANLSVVFLLLIFYNTLSQKSFHI